MFYSIPPLMPHELATPDYLKALTLRITDIQPSGAIFVYYTPFPGMPARFDAERAEQRLPANRGLVCGLSYRTERKPSGLS